MRIFQISSGTHLWAVMLSAMVGACATIPNDVARTARADLNCPHVDVNKLADGRYGAYGCGRGAVYAELCEGGTCRVGRLRHGHEAALSSQGVTSGAEAAPQSAAPAPAPAPREIIPAPLPAQREIIAAPPPGAVNDSNQSAAPDQNQTSDAQAPAPAPVPLAEGDLSAPYQTSVPATPTQQKVTQSPPEPLVEDRPTPPAPTYVWVNGYWWWGSSTWLWVPGYWCPPVVGYSYMPGYWYWSTGYWWYWPGGWGYPGSRVVVYNVAPRPRTVVQVRSFRPRNVVSSTPAAAASSRNVVSSRSVAPAPRSFSPRSSPILHYPTPRAISPATSVRNNAFGGMRPAPSTFSSPGRSIRPAPSRSPGSVGHIVTPSPAPRTSSGVRSTVRTSPNATMHPSVRSGGRPSVRASSVPHHFNMRPMPSGGPHRVPSHRR